jgi:hypothetical protein
MRPPDCHDRQVVLRASYGEPAAGWAGSGVAALAVGGWADDRIAVFRRWVETGKPARRAGDPG